MELLIEADAPVNQPDHRGMLPLHIASEMGGPEYVDRLLAAGADPLATFGQGYTALHRVAKAKTARMLIAGGVSPNARLRDGSTPLHFARSVDVVDVLLHAGADPQARTDTGESPLHHPIDARGIELLVDAGADPNARTEDGVVPLMTQSEVTSIEVLLDRGAAIEPVDHQGRGVLHHYAASYGAAPCIALLLQRGADPMVRDNEGKLPIDLAREMPVPNDAVLDLLEAAMEAGGVVQAIPDDQASKSGRTGSRPIRPPRASTEPPS